MRYLANVPQQPSRTVEAGALIGGAAASIIAILLFANGRYREAYTIGIATTIVGTAFAVGRLYS